MACTPLTFFVELPGAELEALLAQPGVLGQLKARGAALSMALLDVTPERAAAVRLLAAHGIPVTAWLVLEPGDGYWLTADNAPQAAQRYAEIRAWALAEELRFARVGLDIEVPYADAAPLFDAPLRTIVDHLRRARSEARILAARQAYAALLERIRADGYATETYHIPLLLDERKAGSQLLQRVLGLVDVRADRDVWMLYRSVLPHPWGECLVDAYGPDAAAIAVGISGGGVAVLQPAFEARLLGAQTLIDELRRARRHTEHLYVFSLEGCIEAGMLATILDADLALAAAPPTLRHVAGLGRLGLQTALRCSILARRAAALFRLQD